MTLSAQCHRLGPLTHNIDEDHVVRVLQLLTIRQRSGTEHRLAHQSAQGKSEAATRHKGSSTDGGASQSFCEEKLRLADVLKQLRAGT